MLKHGDFERILIFDRPSGYKNVQKEHFVKVFELIGMLLASSDSSKQGELALERPYVRPSYAVVDVEL